MMKIQGSVNASFHTIEPNTLPYRVLWETETENKQQREDKAEFANEVRFIRRCMPGNSLNTRIHVPFLLLRFQGFSETFVDNMRQATLPTTVNPEQLLEHFGWLELVLISNDFGTIATEVYIRFHLITGSQ